MRIGRRELHHAELGGNADVLPRSPGRADFFAAGRFQAGTHQPLGFQHSKLLALDTAGKPLLFVGRQLGERVEMALGERGIAHFADPLLHLRHDLLDQGDEFPDFADRLARSAGRSRPASY